MNKKIRKTVFDADYPVVHTKAGALLGCAVDGIYSFRGVDYATAERYQMPQKIQPWEGIREATVFGKICPSGFPMQSTIYSTHQYWPAGENCQNLNIWTPVLETGARLPVMFWLHGGGYSSGSSIDEVITEGEELARYGEVVVVSINHRLNCLGFLDLSDFGDNYAQSGNLGLMDIVAALQWVRENIMQFGGDPDNVTLFGQSGGGGKIMTLMQMPVADGLYHKAIIQSGVMAMQQQKDEARQFGRKTIELLGLSTGTIDEIRSLPFEKVCAAAQEATYNPALGLKMGLMSLSPVNDGEYILGNYVKQGFRPEVKNIPVMVGSCLGEMALFGPGGIKKPEYPEVDKKSLGRDIKMECLHHKYGDDAKIIAEKFTEAYPEIDILYALGLDAHFRSNVLDYAKCRAYSSSADVYCYLMTYQVKARGGKLAWHGADLPFVFHTAASSEVMCTGGDEILPLMDAMSGAWVAFARTGNPNSELLPAWPAFTHENPATMLFDTPCKVAVGHDQALLPLISKYSPVI